SLGDTYAGVASPQSLILALETLVVEAKFANSENKKRILENQRTKLRHLEARFKPLWGNNGAVAEAFGAAWTEAGDHVQAIAWYEGALKANDGGASLKTSEQLGNLRVRRAWDTLDKQRKRRDELIRSVGSAAKGKTRAEAK